MSLKVGLLPSRDPDNPVISSKFLILRKFHVSEITKIFLGFPIFRRPHVLKISVGVQLKVFRERYLFIAEFVTDLVM